MRAHGRPDRDRAEFNIQFPPLNGMFGLPAGSRQVEESVQRAHKTALSAKKDDEKPSKLKNFKGKKQGGKCFDVFKRVPTV